MRIRRHSVGCFARSDANPGAKAVAIAAILLKPDLRPVCAASGFVEQQPHRAVVVGHDDIEAVCQE